MADTHSITLSNTFGGSSNQYLTAVDSASLSITGDLTIELWMKLTSYPAFNIIGAGMVAKGGFTAFVGDYVLSYSTGAGGKRLHLFITDGVTQDEFVIIQDIGTGAWHHIAVTWKASTSQPIFYFDGSALGGVAAGTVTSIQDSTEDLSIGTILTAGSPPASSTANFGYIDGQIDEIRVWSVVRTATEISDNMCTQIDSATNLQASWHLDNSLVDSSGNSNTLTNHNSATFTTDVPTCLIPPVTFIPQMIII